jgi:transcriptional regulator with XRE-family HTH domain
MTMSDMGRMIREARKAHSKSQSDIADALGVSVQAVSQWETGKTVPTSKNLIDLSKILDLKGALYTVDTALLFAKNPMVKAPLVPWRDVNDWPSIDEYFDWEKDDGFPSEKITPQRYYDVHWKPVGEVFALEMGPAWGLEPFEKGDVIIIDTGRQPESGDYVVFAMGNSTSVDFARYFPKGYDEHRAPIFELRFKANLRNTKLVNSDNPGRVIGVVRELRKFYRTS